MKHLLISTLAFCVSLTSFASPQHLAVCSDKIKYTIDINEVENSIKIKAESTKNNDSEELSLRITGKNVSDSDKLKSNKDFLELLKQVTNFSNVKSLTTYKVDGDENGADTTISIAEGDTTDQFAVLYPIVLSVLGKANTCQNLK